AVVAEESGQFGDLPLAAQDRSCGYRQICLVQALERRKLAAPKLVDALGRGEVLEPVLAEITQRIQLNEGRSGRRDKHLPAVTRGGDPCSTVYIGADVAL